MTEPPEPTRAQLAKIDELAGIYDSVEVQPIIRRVNDMTATGPPWFYDVTLYHVTCWRYRESGAKLVAHALTIHPDGTESDRR